MIWKDCSYLTDSHAFCGGSNYSWRNKTPEQLLQQKINSYSVAIGTLLHEYAKDNIKHKFRMTKQDKHSVLRYLTVQNSIPSLAVNIERLFPNLMLYVNDCIGYNMDPEIRLYYSDNFNGTADAISWDSVHNILRISDLKTGLTPAHFEQLENYAAFFCLNYSVNPRSISKIELRIYQNNEVLLAEPNGEVLVPVIDHIVRADKTLSMLN